MTSPAVRITNPRTDTSLLKTYVELMKLRIVELLLITTLPAMVAAARGWPGWWLAFATLFGGTMSSAGANAINQAIDSDIDGGFEYFLDAAKAVTDLGFTIFPGDWKGTVYFDGIEVRDK